MQKEKLTSAERFSRVKPTANGDFGDVTCQQQGYSKYQQP